MPGDWTELRRKGPEVFRIEHGHPKMNAARLICQSVLDKRVSPKRVSRVARVETYIALYATVEELPIGGTLADLRIGERRHSDCRNSRAHLGPGNTRPRLYLDLETMMLRWKELTT